MKPGLSGLALITVTMSSYPAWAARLGKPRGAGREIEDLADAGLDGAGEGHAVSGGGVLAGHPSLQVGQVAVGGEDLFPGDAVDRLHAVADGVDVRVGGLHVFVDHDAARVADLQARSPAPASCWA